MTNTKRWAVIGGGQSYVMQGANLLPYQKIGDALVVRVGEGTPARLPAPVLPKGGKVLPGYLQDDPADMISGWVRLWIAGFLYDQPGWDGVICALHGDISHWLHISADEVVSSQSFLTPRLITALGGATTADADAIDSSLSRPERLAAYLRAAEVSGRPEALTGYLIGAELAAARPYWLGQQVAMIGEGSLAGAYANALTDLGCPVTQQNIDQTLASGLAALGQALGLVD